MKVIIKFLILLVLLIAFIYLSSLRWIELPAMQGIILVLALLLSLARFGLRKTLTEFKLFLPFVITMFVVYVLIGFIGFKYPGAVTEQSIIVLWLFYGLTRCLLFMSTMFFIQFLLSFVQTNDILALPMSINSKKHFILGRALFLHTIKHLDDLEFHLRLVPEYQQKRLNLKQWFNLKLQLTFGVITMILRESKLRGELIDNRIRHCYNGEVTNGITGGGA